MAAMRMRTILMLALLGGVAVGHPAAARPLGGLRISPPDVVAPEPLLDQSRARLSPADAARQASEQYGGRVLNVSPAAGGYRVKLIEQGNVRTVFIPDR